MCKWVIRRSGLLLNQSSERYQTQSCFLVWLYPLFKSVRVGLISCVFLSTNALAQSSSSDCQCRGPDGQMRDLGSVQCVDISGRPNLMRCVMSTNTPYWKKLDNVEGCPAA